MLRTVSTRWSSETTRMIRLLGRIGRFLRSFTTPLESTCSEPVPCTPCSRATLPVTSGLPTDHRHPRPQVPGEQAPTCRQSLMIDARPLATSWDDRPVYRKFLPD